MATKRLLSTQLRLCATDSQRRAPIRSLASSSSSPVVRQLVDLSEMMGRVMAVNSPSSKAEIAAEYPHLREVIEIISHPKTRFGATPAVVEALSKEVNVKTQRFQDASYASLESFFLDLSNANLKDSKWIAASFLEQVKRDASPEERVAVITAFSRLLDRNLAIGLGPKVFSKVKWGSKTDEAQPGEVGRMSTTGEFIGRVPRGADLESFSCALGKSIQPPFKELDKTNSDWYASRKLDGVRVLTLFDILVPNNKQAHPSVRSVTCISRTGNPFLSLDRLKEHLRYLEEYPKLREIMVRDPTVVEETEEGVIKRLVLDGEVCVMVPAAQNDANARVADDGTGASALWEDAGLIEDFSQAVSLVRRYETMENPAYFVFDMMSWEETATGEASSAPGLGKTFGQRIPETKALVEWLRGRIKEATGGQPRVRVLTQSLVNRDNVEPMVERSLEEGWEGLIFRADTPYVGKRTGDIRKFKKFQDAEYTVVDLEVSQQRLPIDGVYGIYEACSKVVIEHKGVPVGVGSGFTPAERLAFAQDPSLIIGKQITVQYFGESESAARGFGTSLRFPRVKKIWDGQRDV